jgi:protein phosphatase 2C family protein 2/3
MSGTTVNTLLFSGNKLYCANAGDSRSILISKIQFLKPSPYPFTVKPLSIDHKPELEEEGDRIVAMGGRV